MCLVSLVYITIILFTLWIIYRIKNRKIFEYIKNCSEFENYPIIGSAHLFVGKSSSAIFSTFIKKVGEVSSPIKLWIFHECMIIVANPDDVQTVLMSPECINKGAIYELTPIDNGLVQSKEFAWKQQRKLLNPTFHKTVLESFFNIFNDVSIKQCDDLNLVTNKIDFDVAPYVKFHSLDMQLQTSFNIKLSTQILQKLVGNMKIILESLGEQFIAYYFHLIGHKIRKLFKLTSLNQKLLDENYKYLTTDLGQSTENYYADVKQKEAQNKIEENLIKKPEILLNKLTRLTELGYMDENLKKGHIETMMLAGSDTIGITVSNILLLLAMEQEVQENCVTELRNLLGKNIDYIKIESLPKLVYLDRAIKECMRVLPTAPAIARNCKSDLRLSNCTVPKGTDIIISIMNLHLDKEQWGEDPKKFNVDNFLPENIEKRHPVSYIPYSYGARNCFGYKYANYAMKIMIAHLLLKFKFSTKLKYENLKLAFGLTMILKNKHIVSLERR